MRTTALITGASSGIGRELARVHAAKGGDLIITARREASLNALKAELETAHGVTVHTIALDLGAEGGARTLYSTVKDRGLEVDILINNAGFGGHGLHIARDLETELAMIDLNVKALVTLTHTFARDMVARGGGRILNVGSTAGFVPGPLQAVYYATKAFVNSFSQAIDEELREKGVTCSVLTPGLVETGFVAAADLGDTPMTQSGITPDKVARVAYDGLMKGELVIFDRGSLSTMMNWLMPLLPRRRVLKMVRQMQTKPA